MGTRLRAATQALALTLALGCGAAAAAVKAGKTAQGLAYATGGVSHSELVELHGTRDNYSLWVTTAAMKSGAYLADVRIVVRDLARRTVVFDDQLEGPWLFVNLPLGRYEVEASLHGESHKRQTTIHAGDHHQVMIYFDTRDEVAPEYERPFANNPYEGAKGDKKK
jgi:hypothetical protein